MCADTNQQLDVERDEASCKQIDVERDETSCKQMDVERDEASCKQMDVERDEASCKQIDVERDETSCKQMDVERDEASCKQIDVERDEASCKQIDVERDEASCKQMDAGRDEASCKQMDAGLDETSCKQIDVERNETSCKQIDAERDEASCKQMDAGRDEASCKRIDAGLDETSCKQIDVERDEASCKQIDVERDEANCKQIKVGQDPEVGREPNAAVLRPASDEIGQRAGDNQQDSVTQTLEEVDNETLLKFSRSLFKHSPSAIIIYEVHGDGATAADYEIVEANEVCLRTEGWDRSVIGKRLGDLRPAADEYGIIQAFQHVHLTGEVTMFPAKIYREAGQETWFENRIFRLPTGEVVSIYSDITETKQRELHIEYLSRHDSLTGLLNRSAFEEMLNEIEQEGEFPYTVIIGDLDGLKLINDAFGHGVGDEVLKQATDILHKACREGDALCRWGGDEFIVLLRNADENVGHAICNRIRKACKKTAIAHTEGTSISLSLGSATRVSPDEDWREALRNAESAMYKSKLLDTKSYRNVILTSIKNTLFEKSFETEEHGERMAKYCRVMGERIGLGDSVLDELEVLGMLHDIGKIAIDDQILKKPSALTFEEFEKMKRHPEAGYRIASTIPELVGVADYILAHHERWDGTGYPTGLAGEAIPLAARIMSVADAYDAMTSNRPYRKALTEQEAREELRANAGSQFDPAIVQLFLTYLQEA